MAPSAPVFRSHEDAICFACGERPLRVGASPERTGDEAGDGACSVSCPSCHYVTVYDLDDTPVCSSCGSHATTEGDLSSCCGSGMMPLHVWQGYFLWTWIPGFNLWVRLVPGIQMPGVEIDDGDSRMRNGCSRPFNLSALDQYNPNDAKGLRDAIRQAYEKDEDVQ